MTMGFCSIAFLFMLKYCTKLKLSCCLASVSRVFEILLRLISTARNALLVLTCACVAAILLSYNIDHLSRTDTVKAGLPHFAFPTFTYTYYDNSTNQTEHRSFVQIAQHMGSGLVIIPLLSLLEAIAIAKSFSKGKKIDATQEMVAIGICNIMGSFVSSYPTTGSFSRTAINFSSGVRTTAGGIVTGGLVLLALGFMSPYFRFIPKASLAALIFISVLNMVHYKDVIVMWKTNKLDLLPFGATFLLSFILGLEYGIMAGIGLSLLLLLLQQSRPKIVIEEKKTFMGSHYLYVNPDRTILFPAAEKLQTQILKAIPDLPENASYCVVIDGEHLTTTDYTMAINIKSLSDSLKDNDITIIFVHLKVDVQKAIKGSGMENFIHFSALKDAENHVDVTSAILHPPPAYVLAPRYSLRSDDVCFSS